MPHCTSPSAPATVPISLHEGWQLRSEELEWGPEQAAAVLERTEGWLAHPVPGDVRQTLVAHGLLPEPRVGLNALEQDWIEHKSWWFRKSFDVTAEFLAGADVVELCFESLDCEADVWLNGHALGHHRSAHHPFVRDVRTRLHPGENTVLVRLTTGNTSIDPNKLWPLKRNKSAISEFAGVFSTRGDRRRAFLRKPQFCFGWDWAPRLATCAIAGEVTLTAFRTLAVRSIHPVTTAIRGSSAELRVDVEIENFALFATIDARIELAVTFEGAPVFTRTLEDVLLKSGVNGVTFTATVENARLWWPNGTGGGDGPRALYVAEVAVSALAPATTYPVKRGRGATPHRATACTRFGLRTVRLLTERINAEERGLTFEVNGVRIFAKGANWAPVDSLPARVSAGQYRHLVREAQAANFNMLRIWGGGIYNPGVFYDACDELGILVWQDYMFACDIYPDHEEWFRRESELEITYQTRRLRAHPCIALWCGNNESQSGFLGGYFGGVPMEQLPCFGGAHVYNHLAPTLARQLAPEIPYWNGGPYGGESSGSHHVGDNHLCYHDIDLAVFDTQAASHFASEFGNLGPIRASSWRTATGLADPKPDSPEWLQHTNTFSKPGGDVRKAIEFQYGIATETPLSLEEFILLGGMTQGRWYQRAIHTFRAREHCDGALFWMYADCWGEIGWTIIDCYGRRKNSFAFVARAFAPLILILRREGAAVRGTMINDAADAWRGTVELGWMSFDGTRVVAEQTGVEAPAHSRRVAFEIPQGGHPTKEGFYFARMVGGGGADARALVEDRGPGTAVLLPDRLGECALPEPTLRVSGVAERDGALWFTVTTDVFAHGVHFNLGDDARPSDEFFDLMPGESRTVRVPGVRLPAEGMVAKSVLSRGTV